MNNVAEFGNFFGPDTFIIFLVLLLFFGAKRLPELAKGIEEAMREFSNSVRRHHDPRALPEGIEMLAIPLLVLACLMWLAVLVQRL